MRVAMKNTGKRIYPAPGKKNKLSMQGPLPTPYDIQKGTESKLPANKTR
jgi:hypothetical protein